MSVRGGSLAGVEASGAVRGARDVRALAHYAPGGARVVLSRIRRAAAGAPRWGPDVRAYILPVPDLPADRACLRLATERLAPVRRCPVSHPERDSMAIKQDLNHIGGVETFSVKNW